jgi:O-antigen/teichoic acid export membrane protein
MRAKKSKGLNEGIALIYKYVWLAIIPAALIMFAFSAEILGLLFGPAYVGGSNVLKILSIGAIVFSIAQINGAVLNAIGKQDGYKNVVIKGAILNIIGNAILIPFIGIEGAAISTLASYTLMLIGSYLELRKDIKFKFPLMEWAKTLFAGLVGVVAIYATKSLISASAIVKIAFGFSVFGVVFISLVLVMGVINLREIYNLIKTGLQM